MIELPLKNSNNKAAINCIVHVLGQLNVDYQNTQAERKQIATLFPASEKEFTVLEELDLLTRDIRGYASQIQSRGRVDNEREAIEKLQNMRIFEIPAIAQLYFANNGEYKQLKAYTRMLDYLRLLIIEYLRSRQTYQPESNG